MSNKVLNLWISGGGSGVGKALAIQLADMGHRVFISGRSLAKLEKVAAHKPDNIVPLICDIRNEHEIFKAFKTLDTGTLILDGIILCAGICKYLDFPDLKSEVFREVMDTNFHGSVNSCNAALPYLLRTRHDNTGYKPFIAGICSMSTYAGFPRAEAYGASKAAMQYFLESLRADIEHKVDVSIIQLGFIDTPMTEQNDFPMPFLQSSDSAARHIIKKLHRHPRNIIFPFRLHLVLKLLAMFDSIWFGSIVPRMRRN